MNRRLYRLILLGLFVAGCAWTQTPQTSQITIGTDFPGLIGPRFIVDGTSYTSAQTFLWPTNSQHFVEFPLSVNDLGDSLAYQLSPFFPGRYFFNGWKDNTGLVIPNPSTLSVTIIATPNVTSLIASVTPWYPIYITFDPSGAQDPSPLCNGVPQAPSPGISGSGVMYLDGVCYKGSTTVWFPLETHSIQALPYPGYAFSGWRVSPGGVAPFVSQFTPTRETIITPLFVPAKRVEFRTNPVGLSLLVDSTTIQTPPTTQIDGTDTSTCIPDYTRLNGTLSGLAPAGFTPLCLGDFDFLPGSNHSIGAVTPQQDSHGAIWSFEGFSNGLGQNGTYTADLILNSTDVVIANFVPGIRVTFTTYPTGLPLSIDGRTNWPGYGFIWGAGDVHTVSAPSVSTDSHGRQWAFVGWSNQGTQSQTIVVPADPNASLTLSATYAELGQLNLTSSPSGLSFIVDGAPCVTPCSINRAAGTQIQVIAPATTGQTQGSRYDLAGWVDNGSTSTTRQVTFDTNVQNLSVNYHASFLLTTSTTPAGGATFSIAPTSPDGYYAQGTQLSINATAKNGYKFVRWDGDVSGIFMPVYLTMNAPHSVDAVLNQVPFLAPTGVQSIAGPTLDGTVASGSLIAIYGSNLAVAAQLGPSNPLAQTIAGTTVTLGAELLPLIYVSPLQINAQLPSNLAPGDYTITIQNVGQPDVTGTFTVSRDAPVFYQQANPQNQPLVLAFHQDGTPVTFSSPALRNERITIFASGFGPITPQMPDGFAVPASPPYNLADSVMLNLGGTLQLAPDSANAAPGMVGTVVLKLTITDAIPKAATINVTATVNGKNTPQVVLPVQ